MSAAETSDAAALDPTYRKCVATAVARFALAGFELAEMDDGTFAAARWGLVKTLSNLTEAERFLAQVTGKGASA